MENKLSPSPRQQLFDTLQHRFAKNMHRHPGLQWAKVLEKLEANPHKLASINQMEAPATSRT